MHYLKQSGIVSEEQEKNSFDWETLPENRHDPCQRLIDASNLMSNIPIAALKYFKGRGRVRGLS